MRYAFDTVAFQVGSNVQVCVCEGVLVLPAEFSLQFRLFERSIKEPFQSNLTV